MIEDECSTTIVYPASRRGGRPPGQPDHRGRRVSAPDPVTLEVVRNALYAIAER